MPLKKEVKIVKIPLPDNERQVDLPKKFSPMPRLYLELLENKQKIKQDLINKEYVPVKKDYQPGMTKEIKGPESNPIQPEEHSDRDRVDRDKYPQDMEIDENRSISVDSHDDDNDVQDKYRDRDERDDRDERRDKYRDRDERDERRDKYRERRRDYTPDSYNSRSFSRSTIEHGKRRSSSNTSDDSDDLSDRLNVLLRSDSKTPPREEEPKTPSTPVEPYQPPAKSPPTLAQLAAQGQYQAKAELRDINYVTTNEIEEEDSKRELIFKFDMLRKAYPLSADKIPEYTIHSDLKEMKKTYEITVRKLSLDSSVETYKSYLFYGFVLVEYVFGNFLGFEMEGFTTQQMLSMNSYEKLLIELGEKSYVPEGSKWPVELRLLLSIVSSAGIFIVTKMIMRKTGSNLMSMFNNMNGSNKPVEQAPSRPKRRMRGPTINLDDIPDSTPPQPTENKN